MTQKRTQICNLQYLNRNGAFPTRCVSVRLNHLQPSMLEPQRCFPDKVRFRALSFTIESTCVQRRRGPSPISPMFSDIGRRPALPDFLYLSIDTFQGLKKQRAEQGGHGLLYFGVSESSKAGMDSCILVWYCARETHMGSLIHGCAWYIVVSLLS